jgi:hypothetical protein
MKSITINQFVQRYQDIDGSQETDDPGYRDHVVWDGPILDICRESPFHTSLAEVRRKVGYINRLYQCILGGVRDLYSRELAEVEYRVAKAFINQDVDAIMAGLGKLTEFTNDTLVNIVSCHSRLVAIVASAINKNQPVFCSKYASFHFPEIVPILDSKSEGAAKRLVDELVETSTYVGEGDWQQDEDALKRYENHCANLLMLIDVRRKSGIVRPTLKKLDHVLYW